MPVLQQTNGSISWERLASQVAGENRKVHPVSARTIAKFVKATPSFHYFVTRVLPQCTTERVKAWRRCWAIQFHIFWEGAKLIAKKVQVVLFHIDERWFYSLVIQKNNKCVPAFGVQGVWNRVHHKNAINKTLAICAISSICATQQRHAEGWPLEKN